MPFVSGTISVSSVSGNNRVAELTRIPESDFFRFEVEEAGQFRGTATIDSLAHSPRIHILDSRGNLLASPTFAADKTATIENTLGIGEYFFEVTGLQNTSGSDVTPHYEIEIDRLVGTPTATFDIEPNDTPATANNLGVLTQPVTVSGVLEVGKASGNNHLSQLLRSPGSDFYAFEIEKVSEDNEVHDVRFTIGLDRVQHSPKFNLYERDSLDLITSRSIANISGTSLIAHLSVGRYLFEMTGKQNFTGSNVIPNYTVTVEPLAMAASGADTDKEENDSFATANDLGEITKRLDVTGHIDVTAGDGNSNIGKRVRIPDDDYFRFSVSKERDFRFSIALNPVAHAPTLSIYRSDETLIVSELITTRDGTSIQAQLVPGNYFVSITAPQNLSESDAEPNYTLRIDPLDAAVSLPIDGIELEPNDIFASANELGVIDEFTDVTGTLSVRSGLGNSPIGQRARQPNPDFFQFTVEQEHDFTIGLALDRFQHSPTLTLYDAAQQVITASPLQDAAGVLIRETLPLGDYYVSVTAPTNVSGSDVEPNYVLTLAPAVMQQAGGVPIEGIEVEVNDSFAIANQLGAFKGLESILGSIHTVRPNGNNHVSEVVSFPNPDYFSFTTELAGQVSVVVTTDRLPFPITLSLVDATHTVLKSQRLVDGRRVSLKSSELQPGDYFVVLEGPNVVTGVSATPNYTLVIEAPTDELPPDRFEPGNNEQATAPLVTSTRTLQDLSIHDATDIDYVRLDLQAIGTSSNFVRLSHSLLNATADLDLMLFDDQGVLLRESATINPLESLSLDGLVAGTYFAKVVGHDGSIAAYDLHFDIPALTVSPNIPRDTYEPNDSVAFSYPLQAIEGRSSINNLTVHIDTVDGEQTPNADVFSFYLLNDADASHFVRAVTSASAASPSLALYGEAGTIIRTSDDSSSDRKLSLDGLVAGQYFVAVTSTNQNGFKYDLQFSAPEREAGFSITYEIQGDNNPDGFEDALEEAIARWEEIVVGDLPNMRIPFGAATHEADSVRVFGVRYDIPEGKLVDDLHLIVRVDPILPIGNPTIASAAGWLYRTDNTGYLGLVQYDLDDIFEDLQDGSAVETLVHEIGHAFMFPWRWQELGLNVGGNYVGPNAVREYETLRGVVRDGQPVPLEPGDEPGTSGFHISEDVFDNELMTGYDNGPGVLQPLSRLSIAMTEDIGYRVDYSVADPYTLPSPGSTGAASSPHHDFLGLVASSRDAHARGEEPIAARLDNVLPREFRLEVEEIQPTPSGAVIRFNRPIGVDNVNLYSGAGSSDLPDVELVGATHGVVSGSLVLGTDGVSVKFIATGGPLPADNYTLTVRGDDKSFDDRRAGLLDGNQDGVAGGDLVTTFGVVDSDASVISIPDIVRGPGQTVEIPVSINNADGAVALDFELTHDSSLLTVSDVTKGDDLPSDWEVNFDTSISGQVRISLSGTTALSGQLQRLVVISGSIPNDAPYGRSQILQLENGELNSAAAATSLSIDTAIHKVAFPADVDQDGSYGIGDSILVRRVLSNLETGFAMSTSNDPFIVGDADGNGALGIGDSITIRNLLANIPGNLPPLPDLDVTVPGDEKGGLDPKISISRTLSAEPGTTIQVEVMLDVTEPNGITLGGFVLKIDFDKSVLSIANVQLADAFKDALDLFPGLDNATGVLDPNSQSKIAGVGVQLAFGTQVPLLLMDVTVNENAVVGSTAALNIRADRSRIKTEFTDPLAAKLDLIPAPTNGEDDDVDGVITILSNDTTPPTLTSFTRQTPSQQNTSADTLVFRATFSEEVTNVDVADFAASGTSATVTNVATVTGESMQYDITVEGGDLDDLNGAVGLDLSGFQDIEDLAGNALPSQEPDVDQMYEVSNGDTTPPKLSSFTRQNPIEQATSAETLVFRATFDEDVVNVDAADFTVTGTTGMITGVVSANDRTYDITVSGGNIVTSNLTVGLNLSGSQNIEDTAGNALPNQEPPIDETYLVRNDVVAPVLISFTRQDPSDQVTSADTLLFRATFTETVNNIDTSDFAVTGTTATVTNVTMSNTTQYDITVEGGDLATLNGMVGLDLVASQNIQDLAGNALPNQEPTRDEIYDVTNATSVPEINILGNSTTIADDDDIPTVADHTDFGSIDVTTGSIVRTFTIENTGNAALNLTGSPLVAISGPNTTDFTVTMLPDTTVAASDSTMFQVTFDPSAVGSRTATLSIANNDANENSYDFAIQGTGNATPPVPTLSIAATDASKNEGNSGSNSFAFTVTRTGTNLSGTSTANYAVTVGGANAADFVGNALPSGSVSFAANDPPKVISIPVNGDTTVESDEGFTVTLSSPVGATISTATANGTIINDDAAPTLSITPTDARKNEGDSGDTAFTFTVTRTGTDLSGPTDVDYAVTGSGTNASDAADFGGTLPSGNVSFAADETSKMITVSATGDTDVEADERFTVTLSSATDGATITTGTADGVVRNDDGGSALQLDQEHGLFYTGNLWQDWGGLNEKWVRGNGGQWYYITPAGEFFEWHGGDVHDATRIATLSEIYHESPELLYEAERFAGLGSTSLEELSGHDEAQGFYFTGDYWTDWGSRGEKWFKDRTGAWYFILPDGEVYLWDRSDEASGTLFATLDSGVHANPALLHDAFGGTNGPDPLPELDRRFGFRFAGSLWSNWGGRDERWFKDRDDAWYFILPNGEIYKWDLSRRAMGTLVATFSSDVHTNPSLLFDADKSMPAEADAAEAEALAVQPPFPHQIGPWTNPLEALDINVDGAVSPLDALILINRLNESSSAVELPAEVDPRGPSFYYDATNDGFLTPLDVLRIVNLFNNNTTVEAESAATVTSNQIEPQIWDAAMNKYLADSD